MSDAAATDVLRSAIRALREGIGVVAELRTAVEGADPALAPLLLARWQQVLGACGVIELATAVPDVGGILDVLDRALADGASFGEQLAAIADLSTRIGALANTLGSLRLAPGVTPGEVALRLVETLAVDAIDARAPFVVAPLRAFQFVVRDAGLWRIAPDNFGALLKNPGDYFAALFGPDAFADLARTTELCDRVLAPLADIPLPGSQRFYGVDTPGAPPFFLVSVGDFSMSIEALPRDAGGPAFRVSAGGGGSLDLPISDWTLSLGIDAAQALQVTLGLDGSIKFDSHAPSLSVALAPPADARWVLGEPDGLRLEFGAPRVSVAIGEDDMAFGFALDKGVLVLRAPDGFLRAAIPGDVDVPFSFGVDFSWKHGVHLRGGVGFDVKIPLGLQLGPLALSDLDLRFSFDGAQLGLGLGLGVGVGFQLGPVAVSVDGIGLALGLAFGGGNLGFAEFLPPDIQWPTGVGLSIDATVVKGGGYLQIDRANHRYAGAGSLAIRAGVEVTLDIVLLITADPNPAPGAPSFSMLLLACVEFSPGIALFGGFFLTGLGLLVGIEREMNADAIRDGVRSGLMRSILFPTDPVANAPKLLGNLERAFPAAKDRFVIGALAKVSYGTGAAEIFSAEIGLAVQIGGPFVLAVFGRFALKWPRDEEKAILLLQLDCAGLWDSAKNLLSIDASLHDSRILTWPLSGDAAFRAGGDVGFLLSIGGYHPHFAPPPGFPALERLALTISAGSIARLRVEMYTAVTSNTFQLGAHADAVIDLKVCSIEGHFAFDALVQFHPFHFEIDISAMFAIKVAGTTLLGIGVALHVSGPNPWHINGTVEIDILLFKIKAGFEVTFGDALPPASLPLADARSILAAALQLPRAWSAALPSGLGGIVALASPASPNAVCVHPLAALRVQQREIPLHLELDRVGAQRVSDRAALSITGARVAGGPAELATVQDQFAAGQFLDLSDEEKLARPSFERMDAGVVLAVSGTPQSAGVATPVDYDTWIRDDAGTSGHAGLYELPAAAVVAASPAPAPAAAPRIAVAERAYVVASRTDLSRADAGAPVSYARAAQAARRLGGPRALRTKLQLVGKEEVA